MDQQTAAAQSTFEIRICDLSTACGSDRSVITVLLVLGRFLLRAPIDATLGKSNLPLVGIDSQNLDFHFFANFDQIFRVLDFVIRQFRDVQQAFESVFETDKHTKVGDLGDFAFDHLARLVASRNIGRPWIVSQLLQAECDSAAIGIDRKNLALKFLSFF